MKTTEEMNRYIAMQRTGYNKDIDISKCYQNDISRTYENIKNFLPVNTRRILDIGCGIGGIDLMLNAHYQGDVDIHLFDYSEIDRNVYYGYNEKGSIYNSLELSRMFLEMNGVRAENIYTHDAKWVFPENDYGIIVSLLSCGFHYPISTYLADIKKCLAKGGSGIFDLRKNTGQIELLKKSFSHVEIIADFPKCERVVIG